MMPITLQGKSAAPYPGYMQTISISHLPTLMSSHSSLPAPIFGNENKAYCIEVLNYSFMNK